MRLILAWRVQACSACPALLLLTGPPTAVLTEKPPQSAMFFMFLVVLLVVPARVLAVLKEAAMWLLLTVHLLCTLLTR